MRRDAGSVVIEDGAMVAIKENDYRYLQEKRTEQPRAASMDVTAVAFRLSVHQSTSV